MITTARPVAGIQRAHSKTHDLLLVSSFGVWAVVLGVSPVLLAHYLMV